MDTHSKADEETLAHTARCNSEGQEDPAGRGAIQLTLEQLNRLQVHPGDDDTVSIDIDGPSPLEISTRLRPSRRLRALSIESSIEETERLSKQIWSKARESVLQRAVTFWNETVSQLWLPLLGLACLGSALTVRPWLAVLDILVGLPLVHMRAWQDWCRVSRAESQRARIWLQVERTCAVCAAFLTVLTLVHRAAFPDRGALSLYDVLSMAFAVGGASSTWCKKRQASPPRLRELPAMPVLVLLCAITTLAPVPATASLPYMLFFIALLMVLVSRYSLGSLSFAIRLCLLALTSLHIIVLLTLSFCVRGAPHELLSVLGQVGWSMLPSHGAQMRCPSESTESLPGVSCPQDSSEGFWTGIYVTWLLLLHFVLTNVSVHGKETRAPVRPEPRTRDATASQAWGKIAVRFAFFAVLITNVMWFPSLMTLPLLLMAWSMTISSDGCLRNPGLHFELRSQCCLRTTACCSCRTSSIGVLVTFLYAGLVFLVGYVFCIIEGDLPGRPPVSSWVHNSLHLDRQVPTSTRSWLECIGLESFRSGSTSRAAEALFPRAVLLACLSGLGAILMDPSAPRQQCWQYLGVVLERLWGKVSSAIIPEISMVGVLLLAVGALVSCEDGRSSVITIGYVLVLVMLVVSPGTRLLRQRALWSLLQALATLGSTALVLVHVTTGPPRAPGTPELPRPLNLILTSSSESLSGAVGPHLGVALCAGLQRMRLSSTVQWSRSRTAESCSVASVQDAAEEAPKTWLLGWRKAVERGTGLAVRFLDRRRLKALKLLVEEGIVLTVMLLSLVTALMPPTDIHSLVLLVIVGPALLLYNLKDNREWLLLQVLRLLQHLAALFLLARTATASPLVQLPDSAWHFSLQELGINRQALHYWKLVLLGTTAILTRVAMQALQAAMREAEELTIEQVASPLGDAALRSTSVVPPTTGAPLQQHSQAHVCEAGLCGEHVELAVEEHLAQGLGGPHSKAQASRRACAPRWEERLLDRWLPRWMPLQAHAYFSALLLIVSFAVSITEVHVLNFLMILAVVSLCGWKELWVQAGTVFSVTTVGIMLLQYISRFQYWADHIEKTSIQRIGLSWSANQVVRHCSILVLCFAQKQLWHRGRNSKPREPICPRWLSRHADVVGMAAVLVVAVARRHAWSPILTVAALPWLVKEEPTTSRMSGWLRFFRFVLLVSLLGQVLTRLVVEFEMQDHFDPLFGWSCRVWEDGVAAVNETVEATYKASAFKECIGEWRAYVRMFKYSGTQLLWEFLALLSLGVVQQSCDRVEHMGAADVSCSHWKLLVMHWWPCLIYLLTFVLSLEGGSFLGMAHLLLLLGAAFSSSDTLLVRRRWAWRIQLCAWFLLMLGFCVQSPLPPCSRASCEGRVHRTFLGHAACARLEGINRTEAESEAQTSHCGSGAGPGGLDQGATLGHDTPATLLMQAVGFRRLAGSGFGGGIFVLLGSQLGLLLQLILASAVQLRIYNSISYREKVEDNLLSEPRALLIERARRYVHEFHCHCSLEESASRERHRALRDKLKRTMLKINEILMYSSLARVETREQALNLMEEATKDRRRIAEEEVQISHGVSKATARDVTFMFNWDVSISKQYLNILREVTIGRLRPDGELVQSQVDRLLKRVRQRSNPDRELVSRRQVTLSLPKESAGKPPEPPPTPPWGGSESWRARIEAWRRCLLDWWGGVKRSSTLARCMCDYAFLGVDESKFSLRPPDSIATEELHEHRQGNGLFRIVWKLLLSNMLAAIAVAAVMAFTKTHSILDLVRTFMVFFVALAKYPFPPHELWTCLIAYSVVLLLLRTFYDLPIFCTGPAVRRRMQEADRLPWEPTDTFAWCPLVTKIGFDITLGIEKQTGASALEPSSWISAVWADHLCIWMVLLHRWVLSRSGLRDHVVFDPESQQVWLRSAPAPDPTARGSEALAAADEPLLINRRRGHGQACSEPVFKATHLRLLELCAATRRAFVNDYDRRAALRVLEEERRGTEVVAQREEGGEEEQDEEEEEEEMVDGAAEEPLSIAEAAADAAPQAAFEPSLGSSGWSVQEEADEVAEKRLMGAAVGADPAMAVRPSPSASTQSVHVMATGRRRMPGTLRWRLLRRGRLDAADERATNCDPALNGSGHLRDPEEVVKPLLTIQRAIRMWLEGKRKQGKIRCSMGHPLKMETCQASLYSGVRTPWPTLTMRLELQMCERCCKVIHASERWSCHECDYHACTECVHELMQLDQGMGKQDGLGSKSPTKPGISLYWAKYVLSLLLLVYALVASKAIFQQEDRNLSEAIQASTVSVPLLMLLVLHLSVMVFDRILHKSYYRFSKQPTRLRIIYYVSIGILVAEFLFVHVNIIVQLTTSTNPSDASIQLHTDTGLCLYYIGWMVYLGVCMAQLKHGLPAVDQDMMRSTATPESQGVWIEKLQTWYWYSHYYLPFVDDLRVIIDWTVMPTSLDLWMHFKVEDAHSWLFRTRHVMFVRRQSYFAEPRDACEKVYSGWFILLLLVFIILMPIIVFSPITPFPNSVLIDSGTATLSLMVASSCSNPEQSSSSGCQLHEILLYQAAATQIVEYNVSQVRTYQEQHPEVTTSVDFQDVVWPRESRVPLDVSPQASKEMGDMLDTTEGGVATVAIFALQLQLSRDSSVAGPETKQHVCYCAPAVLCAAQRLKWPPGVAAACGSALDGDVEFQHVARWWAKMLEGGTPPALRLDHLWVPVVHVGTGVPVLKGARESLRFRLTDCARSRCWGSLLADGEQPLRATFELERSAMLSPLTPSGTSYSVIGLYLAVVLVAGRYLRAAFQDSSKRAIYEEIPDVGVFLDLVTGVKLARDFSDLRTEFQLYYCLMKVLRSTNLLLTSGGHEPVHYGVCRHDACPPECAEPIHHHEPVSPSAASLPRDMSHTETLTI